MATDGIAHIGNVPLDVANGGLDVAVAQLLLQQVCNLLERKTQRVIELTGLLHYKDKGNTTQ